MNCGTKSDDVSHWFNRGQEVINRQIQTLDPQIIFGCAPHIPQIFAEAGLTHGNGINSAGWADYAWIAAASTSTSTTLVTAW